VKLVVGVLAILLVGCGQPMTWPRSEPSSSARVQGPFSTTPPAQPTPRLFAVNELAGLSFSDGLVFDAPNVERKLTGVAALLGILPRPRGDVVPSGFIESYLVERSGEPEPFSPMAPCSKARMRPTNGSGNWNGCTRPRPDGTCASSEPPNSEMKGSSTGVQLTGSGTQRSTCGG
jgi:hypothetical protein